MVTCQSVPGIQGLAVGEVIERCGHVIQCTRHSVVAGHPTWGGASLKGNH